MLNRWVGIGRLTRDPELQYTPNGIAVTKFTLAVDRPFTSQNGEREADFIPVVVWRQAAEACANYLAKGRLVAVEGRIQVRNYENSEGKRIYITEVIADNVRFLEHGESRQSSNHSNNGSANESDPFSDDGKPIDISDDDLPF
ncbi:single-stranded DNA-binding protein [Paenibacillus sp. 79R4]|uniref:single-stranded DNA-binding protein n=1 Tax=Paenibacillus sp. 79R4 TaxID=2212847 RepID=UPI0015BC78D5|nr:single-stranded DNA-binding protein [Paenibacillus sp. 79R4]NWL87588.1 single-stranded DNA-binding protein [Paenibacillus sp. 79R4]